MPSFSYFNLIFIELIIMIMIIFLSLPDILNILLYVFKLIFRVRYFCALGDFLTVYAYFVPTFYWLYYPCSYQFDHSAYIFAKSYCLHRHMFVLILPTKSSNSWYDRLLFDINFGMSIIQMPRVTLQQYLDAVLVWWHRQHWPCPDIVRP